MVKNITWRSIIISLLLTPINIWWVTQYEIVIDAGSTTTLSVFYTSVFILLLAIGVNMLLVKYFPKKALSQAELLIIYILLNITSSVVSHDFMHVFVSSMPFATRYATAENNWYNLFINKIPDWAIVKDKAAVDAFYLGGDSFYQWKYVKHWIRPMIIWGIFMMVIFYVMLCINTILRKQWTENEKLAFPLVSLPIEMTKEKTDFFNSKTLYYGIAVAIVFTSIQALSSIIPTFPVLNLKNMDLSQYLVNPPFNAIGMTPIRIYPIAIGISFLVPTDLSFSYWFFYLFVKFQYIFGASVGINTIPKYPFINEQCLGFLVGICVFAIVMGRNHFKAVFMTIFGKKTEDDSNEPMGYKHAVWGMIIGLFSMMIFSKILGTAAWLAAVLVLGYFIIVFSLTRTRAELGTPCHEVNWSNITAIMLSNAGTATMGAQNVIGIQMFFWFNRCFRSNMMPIQLESFKMVERTGISYRKMAGVMMAFSLIAIIIGFTIILGDYYKYGGAANMPLNTVGLGQETFVTLENSLKSGTITDWNGIGASIAGFFACIALSYAKITIPGFPLNPVAYAMMSTFSTHFLWSSIFISWVCKVFILRYGGLKVFTKALPFFLGLILGDCIAGSIWCILSIILGMKTYVIFP